MRQHQLCPVRSSVVFCGPVMVCAFGFTKLRRNVGGDILCTSKKSKNIGDNLNIGFFMRTSLKRNIVYT